jgi:hypothetical protein
MASVTASRRSLISAAGSTYSVWSTWAGLTLTAYVGVDTVEVVGPDGTVTHPRQRFGRQCIDYRHYLRELARKPQALRQVVAKLLPLMDKRFAKAWVHLVDAHGPKQASRVMAQVLKAVDANGEAAVAQRLELALMSGEPLQLAVRPMVPTSVALKLDALPASLRDITVAAASAADFDALLGGAR